MRIESVSSAILASVAVLGILGGIVGLWVDARISKKLAPIIQAIADIKYEYLPNGGIKPRRGDGKPDGTSKDMQSETLQLVQRLSQSVSDLSAQINGRDNG